MTAARKAFESYSQSSREQRIALMEALVEAYKKRYQDIAEAISEEMGAPTKLAVQAQAGAGLGHLVQALEVLRNFDFEEGMGPHRVFKEPIGVCGMITPWNWPVNQISCKVAPGPGGRLHHGAQAQ